jgi:hypothetical protein
VLYLAVNSIHLEKEIVIFKCIFMRVFQERNAAVKWIANILKFLLVYRLPYWNRFAVLELVAGG